MKKLNAKGFTLAELLIVVAIIAVLVAVSIPVFTAQLEKSREETDIANLRSAYAIASTDALTGAYKKPNGDEDGNTEYVKTGTTAGEFVYASYYNVKTGKLTSSDNTGCYGKGTGAKGGCDEYDEPLIYTQDVVANTKPITVLIIEKDGVPDKIYAGFAASSDKANAKAKTDLKTNG